MPHASTPRRLPPRPPTPAEAKTACRACPLPPPRLASIVPHALVWFPCVSAWLLPVAAPLPRRRAGSHSPPSLVSRPKQKGARIKTYAESSPCQERREYCSGILFHKYRAVLHLMPQAVARRLAGWVAQLSSRATERVREAIRGSVEKIVGGGDGVFLLEVKPRGLFEAHTQLLPIQGAGGGAPIIAHSTLSLNSGPTHSGQARTTRPGVDGETPQWGERDSVGANPPVNRPDAGKRRWTPDD